MFLVKALFKPLTGPVFAEQPKQIGNTKLKSLLCCCPVKTIHT